MTVVAIALAVLGGGLELAGLWLVFRDIGRDQEHARQALGKPSAIVPPERTYPAAMMASGGPRSVAGGIYTTEYELRQQAANMERLAVGVGNALLQLRKKLEAQLDQAVLTARQEAYDRAAELRTHLLYVLTGSLHHRRVSAGLLAAGIVLTAAASVLSTLA